MSDDGVYEDDMDDTPELSDPALADFFGDMRLAYGSRAPRASLALTELMESGAPERKRTSMRRTLAQFVVATTAVVAAMGGLAVAGALPGPVQDALSTEADEPSATTTPSADESTSTTTTSESPTSTTPPTTASTPPTTTPAEGEVGAHPDNHGAEVSAVAQDKSLHGCEHGRAVSEVASGKRNEKPCPHASTTTTPASPAVEAPEQSDEHSSGESDVEPDNSRGSGSHEGNRGHGNRDD